MPSRRRSRFGFSLVELLVVISIVALLIALLLPALAKAKYVGRLTLCAARLKQHGIGVISYTTDAAGWYPYRAAVNGPVAGGFSDLRQSSPGGPDDRPMFRPYLPIDATFACPLSPITGSLDTSTAAYVLSGYFMWYSNKIAGPAVTATPLFRLTDRLTINGREFRVLASDADYSREYYVPTPASSHPDSGPSSMTMTAYNDAGFTVTQWAVTGPTRGKIDRNVLNDDGSVRTQGGVAYKDYSRSILLYQYWSWPVSQYCFFPIQ